MNENTGKTSEKGQGLVEYAAILLLVAILIFGVIVLLGIDVQALWTNAVCPITTVMGGAPCPTPTPIPFP